MIRLENVYFSHRLSLIEQARPRHALPKVKSAELSALFDRNRRTYQPSSEFAPPIIDAMHDPVAGWRLGLPLGSSVVIVPFAST
jgi:hypothetical protein